MVYETREEMNAVVGKIEDNQFIQDQFAELESYKKTVKSLMKKFWMTDFIEDGINFKNFPVHPNFARLALTEIFPDTPKCNTANLWKLVAFLPAKLQVLLSFFN